MPVDTHNKPKLPEKIMKLATMTVNDEKPVIKLTSKMSNESRLIRFNTYTNDMFIGETVDDDQPHEIKIRSNLLNATDFEFEIVGCPTGA